MYDDFEMNDGLSIIEVLKVSFGINKKRKINFAIISSSIAIVVFIFLFFVYNYAKTSYTAEFDYVIPSLIETTTEEGVVTNVSYLDGTPFNINGVVTLSNLQRVKESNEDFKNIDVEKIYKESEISASKLEDMEYPYTISIKKKYFESEEQARDFFAELIRYPLIVSQDLVNSTNNNAYLTQARKSDISLDEVINNLIYQADYIISTYDALIEESPDVYVQYNGLVKFNELKNLASSRIDSLGLTLLLSEVESNHYVRNLSDPNVQAELNTKYSNLKAEAEKLDSIVTNYKNMMSNISVINEEQFTEFIKAVDRKAIVDYQVHVYEGYCGPDAKESDEVEVKLKKAIDELQSITNILTLAQKGVYSSSASTVYYSTNKVVTPTSNINVFIAIIIGIVVGVIVAGVVNCILDVSNYKTAKYGNNENKTEKTTE